MTERLKTDVIINRDALFALRELPSDSVLGGRTRRSSTLTG